MTYDHGELLTLRQNGGPIAVGVDGSRANRAALRWAASAAHRDGVSLQLVHVVDEAFRTSPYFTVSEIMDACDQVMAGAINEVAAVHPDVTVVPVQLFGYASRSLRAAADGASLLVLGRRGRGSFGRMLLGSVSASVGNQAAVPTAVIPSEWDASTCTDASIVVGVDGSPGGESALQYAVELADRSGLALKVVYVWGPEPIFPAESVLAHGGLRSWHEDAAEIVTNAVEPWHHKYPLMEISEVLHQGHVVRALTDESASARALVVGGHLAGRLHALVVGSTTNGVLHHAQCPLIVLPDVD